MLWVMSIMLPNSLLGRRLGEDVDGWKGRDGGLFAERGFLGVMAIEEGSEA